MYPQGTVSGKKKRKTPNILLSDAVKSGYIFFVTCSHKKLTQFLLQRCGPIWALLTVPQWKWGGALPWRRAAKPRDLGRKMPRTPHRKDVARGPVSLANPTSQTSQREAALVHTHNTLNLVTENPAGLGPELQKKKKR